MPVPLRRLTLVLALLCPLGASAQPAATRVLEAGRDAVTLEVRLPAPAAVEVVYGQELFDWTGRTESLDPEERHELRLGKLTSDRTYFYQVLVDGVPGEVLTLRSGRAWAERRATLVAFDGEAADSALADRLFGLAPDSLLALGGDGGQPESLRTTFARTLAERPLLELGGTGDTDPLRLVSVSDVALALTGEQPLVGTDGTPTPAASWATSSLPGVEGACWQVVASATPIEPGSTQAESLRAWAVAAGVDVLITRATTSGVQVHDDLTWLHVSGGSGDDPKVALLEFTSGKLTARLETLGGEEIAQATAERTCAGPAPPTADPFGDDPFGDGLGDDLDGMAEECDY